MPWIPIEQRDQSTIGSLKALLHKADKTVSFETLYNEKDLGMLANSEFSTEAGQVIKSLLNKEISTEASSNSKSNNTADSTEDAELREGDLYNSKSLRYLKVNAETKADRQWAESLYAELLLDLWRQYVMQTGETYYTPLADDLFNYYEFNNPDG